MLCLRNALVDLGIEPPWVYSPHNLNAANAGCVNADNGVSTLNAKMALFTLTTKHAQQ